MTDPELTHAIEALRPALRLHCYRMLGSASDADDMVQEALLRAWNARGTLEDPARVKGWLYRIATNASLDELQSRKRRVLASDLVPPSAGDSLPPAAPVDAPWLEPVPDSWMGGVAEDPAARYTLRESVALAFVAALQVLSPAQRATLLLRDVIGLSAEEAASALAQSVASVNSALHRAREAIGAGVVKRELTADDEDVLARYVQALAAHDVDAMIALVHEDMHTTMPPSPTWIRGYADSVVFYRKMFARWDGSEIRARRLGVSGGAGFAFERDGVVTAIEAVEVRDGRIHRMHHFMQPALIALFASS